MKKLLALVLALVMTMGLATVATNAAFPDASDISLTEAVDVMSAVGVFQGNESGNFLPTANLDRASAAKLIAYLDLGEKTAEALPAVQAFPDVPATNWAAKYIAYCKDAGYISGDANGNFLPTTELNGYSFGKMVLCVLGYDADIEGFTGSTWSISIAKLLQSNDITDGVDGAASATLTREQAAQYCLNALKANMVEYENKGTSISINGATIATGASSAKAVTDNAVVTAHRAIKDENPSNTIVQLGEKLYSGDLKLDSATASDDFKRPANEWKYKNETIGTYGKSADQTFVATKTYTTVAGAGAGAPKAAALSAQINDQLGITKDSNKLTFTDTADNEYLNGAANAYNDIQLGDVVEVYVDSSDAKNITTVAITRYTTNKITDVSTTLAKAQKDDGATCKVQINGGTYYLSNKIADFDAATFVKDAYIMYVASGTELIATAIPTTVTGEVTAIKGTTAQINGTYYEKNGKTVNSGDEGTFYLGKANEIVAIDATASKSTDYAYIYNWTYESKTDSDGATKPTITLYYVTVDGTKASAVAKTETTGTGTVSYYIDNGTTGQGMILGTLSGSTWTKDTSGVARVVAFSINSDGKFVQKTPKDSIVANVATATVNKTSPVVDNSKVATNSTNFIFVYDSDGYKTKTAVGYKNVSVTSAPMTTIYNSDNEALYTFVGAQNGFKSDTKLAVVLDKEPSATSADGDTFNTYTVAIGGEETTLTFKNATLTGPYAGMVFAYQMNGDYAEIDTAEGASGYLTEKFVFTKGDGYFGSKLATGNTSATGDAYLSTAEAKVYTITIEFKNSTDKASYDTNHTAISPESITVSEGATFDADDPIYYTIKNASDKTAGEVYVVEYVY